jgi:hypothetical protein
MNLRPVSRAGRLLDHTIDDRDIRVMNGIGRDLGTTTTTPHRGVSGGRAR